jgi:drug/metabolite transporter (DMT)-like permease
VSGPTGASPALGARRGLLLVVLLGLIWGSTYPVIRFGIVSGASPIAFAAARYALTAVAIAGVAAASGLPRPNARGLALSAVLGLPIVGIYGLLLYVGEQTTSGGLASILIAVTPLLTALFALPVLPNERLPRLGVLGLAVGFVGVFVLVVPPPGITLASTIWGPIAVLGASVSFAVGSVMLRVRRPEGETLWGVTVQFAVATGFLAVLLPVFEPHAALPLSQNVFLSLAYLVALPSVAGYALYFYLHHHVGPGRANVVAYVNPVAALSIGTLLFGEPFEWWELAGFALVVVGLTLLTQSRRPAGALAGAEAGKGEGG